MENTDRSRPKYQVIAEKIRAKIESGAYLAGAQLPTKAALVEEYDAALGTIDRALEVLRADGLTDTYHGVGTFVRGPEPEAADPVAELAERVAQLEAQMMDVYANLGINAPSADAGEQRRVV
ncbi:winged helix-turn-helix domain-containing protein [Nocardia sp. XZ_19_231]|uniref:GntR family transcriptional regulator n=1 Tax=Nocardia sp. XZ_19_231 TaxID=2769252 RepID=UPI00188E96D4|nr:winged helix-turn-helix domain-containing protein [Nocardia sp. XZ_19_231]